jgi:hypothetical protein
MTGENNAIVMPESNLLFGQYDPQTPVMLQRWTPVPVSSIESVEIINAKFEFQNETRKYYNSQHAFSAPTLVRAEMRISFAIPFRVDSLANYSANVLQENTISSRETTINIGSLSSGSTETETIQTPEQLPFQQMSKMSLVIPILDSAKPTAKPFLDRFIKPKGPGVTHHTIKLHGISAEHMKTVCHFIRFKVNHAVGNRIEGLNVTTSAIDMPRIAETWSLFVEWLKQATNKVQAFVTSSAAHFRRIEAAPTAPAITSASSTITIEIPQPVAVVSPPTPTQSVSLNSSTESSNGEPKVVVMPQNPVPVQYYYQIAPPNGQQLQFQPQAPPTGYYLPQPPQPQQ